MIKISVLYPNNEGAKFDMAYYCQTHMPLVKRLLSSAVKGMAVDQGIGGFGPGTPPLSLRLGISCLNPWRLFRLRLNPTRRQSWATFPITRTCSPRFKLAKSNSGI